MTSALQLFSVGIGPSSSHTVAPMRAAKRFAERLRREGLLEATDRVNVELFGSLGLTGRGHGTDKALILGLEGEDPERVDTELIPARIARVRESGEVQILGTRALSFEVKRDLRFHRRARLEAHSNGMRFRSLSRDGETLLTADWYSVGGGFLAEAGEGEPRQPELRHPFRNADELLEICETEGLSVSEVVRRNEQDLQGGADVGAQLLAIWSEMEHCIERGLRHDGALPGGLGVPRRAPALARQLAAEAARGGKPSSMEWVAAWAIAVNEENAAGGRVVTAPTNGAAGTLPAVLRYYVEVEGGSEAGVVRFLLAATAIGAIVKDNASISGAEVGCQGEVGSACAMASAGLAEACGGSPTQVENAAEIGLEHHLGLTCDPVGGLVQVPCIERNALAAVKAITAARLALRGSGQHLVSFDQAVRTMAATGRDMRAKYKETSRGGLAVNVTEC